MTQIGSQCPIASGGAVVAPRKSRLRSMRGQPARMLASALGIRIGVSSMIGVAVAIGAKIVGATSETSAVRADECQLCVNAGHHC